MGNTKDRKLLLKWLFFAIFFLCSFNICGETQFEAAWSNNPKEITTTWEKCGSKKAKLVNGTLYISSGRKIEDVRKAYYDNNYIVYYVTGSDGYRAVFIHSCKEDVSDFILYDNSSGIQDFMGFYKGYVYYLKGHYTEHIKAYKIRIKKFNTKGIWAVLGDEIRIPALDNGGGALQYKNYIYVMGMRGDPSPTTLKIYNLKTGKCTTVSSACSTARIINGRLYYSVTVGNQRNGMGYKNYKHTVYVCNANGTGKKKLSTFVGRYLPPVLDKKQAYYYTENNVLVRRKYGTKKDVVVNKNYYHYYLRRLGEKGTVVSAG